MFLKRPFLFIGVLFVTIFVRSAIAQAPPICPTLSSLPGASVGAAVPGMNCGLMDDPDPCKRLCCPNAVIPTQFITLPGILNIIPGVEGFLNQSLQDKLNPILEYKRQNVIQPCADGSPNTPGDLTNPACMCVEPTPATLSALMNLCSRLNGTEQGRCNDCLSGGGKYSNSGVWTSIGCVDGNLSGFIQNTLLGWGIGLAGGLAMLCIIYSAIMMQTSGGNAEKVKKAQQLMTSCITGLMIIIFSVFILRLIGVSILRIPGFM